MKNYCKLDKKSNFQFHKQAFLSYYLKSDLIIMNAYILFLVIVKNKSVYWAENFV